MISVSHFKSLLSICLLLSIGLTASVLAQSTDAEPQFDVLEYVVEGNTRLSSLRIEEVVYPFLGLGKTLKDVEAAREALEKAYQSAGFVTVGVDIPEQSTIGGVIVLKVLEGKIDRVSIRGTKYFSASMIRERLAELKPGSVPDSNVVKTEIAQLNRNPNRKVVPALKPGKLPGTVDVDLTVDETLPISGSTTLSNFRPSSSKNWLRLGTDVKFENVGESFFGSGHTLGLSAFTTPQDLKDTQLLSMNYLVPTKASGTFLFFALRSKTESLSPVGAFLVQGQYTQLGLRYFYPLAEAAGSRLSLALGLDRKANQQTVASTGSGALVYYPYTVGLNYQSGDSESSWKFDTTWIGGLGTNQINEQEFTRRRIGSSSDFGLLRLDGIHERNLGGQFRLKARVSAQLTSRPLINLEQAVAGGYDTVRGYFEAEQIGDQATRASVEANYALKTAGTSLKKADLIAFLDMARLDVISPAIGQTDKFLLASTGIGSRIRFGTTWQVVSDLAYPLRSVGQTQKGHLRLLARIVYEY